MIALKEQTQRTRYESGEDNEDYMEGYTDGFLDASRNMEGDAFFEIGLVMFSLVVGVFFGWAVAGL